MSKKLTYKSEKIIAHIKQDVKNGFYEHCEENSLAPNKILEKLIVKFLEQNK